MIRDNAVFSNRRDFLRGTLLGGALSLTAVAAWPNLARATASTASKSSASMATPFAFESAGARIAGLLHMPSTPPIAAVVLCGAWTAVKEQATGVYASALAERGLAALAFDHRFFGESGGEPRQFENPAAKIEDIRNAVTALLADERTRSLPVMAVGICAGGGYMARAVADDTRIQAFAGVAGAYTDASQMRTRLATFDQLVERGKAAERKWRETGQTETIPAVAANGGDVAMPFAEAFDYYGTRAAVPNYVNGWAVQSYAEVLHWDAIGAAPSIKVPTLVVHSEQAAMPDLARRLVAEVSGPKSELWLTSRNHVDFYDNPQLVGPAADAVAKHFREAVA